MATLTKQAKPAYATYTVELNESEAQGLKQLLNAGVGMDTLAALSLTQLTDLLYKELGESPSSDERFLETAKLGWGK